MEKSGEDITNNFRVFENLPLKVNDLNSFTVRGEVFMSKEDFENLNKIQEKNGEKLFANPRNVAAGSLRQKNINIVKDRKLQIYIFNMQEYIGKEFETHTESLEYLEKLGFIINPYILKAKGIDEVIKRVEEIKEKRPELKFLIDGAVIKVNNLKDREKLGTTVKYPKWAIAFKYPPEQVETVIKDIVCTVRKNTEL